MGVWLVEYDLAYEPLKSMKGQIVADFIIEHRIDLEQEAGLNIVSVVPWKLYFDGLQQWARGRHCVYFTPRYYL